MYVYIYIYKNDIINELFNDRQICNMQILKERKFFGSHCTTVQFRLMEFD